MNIKTTIVVGLLSGMLLSACSTFVPIDFNPDKLAYAVLDGQGNPTLLCFDTISPNHCIQSHDEPFKGYNLKQRILLQKYILVLGEPSQIDCKLSSPNDCRIYFEHIYVDISINPDEIKTLKEMLKDTVI